MNNTRSGLDTKHFEPVTALSADLAQMPDKPSASGGTGKEQWIGNPQDAELGRLQSAESADYSHMPTPNKVMEMAQHLIDRIADPEKRELMQLEHDILKELRKRD